MSFPDRKHDPWSSRDLLVIVALTITASLLYFMGLSEPNGFIYDEGFYVAQACDYQESSAEGCDVPRLLEVERHPPLGSWLIAAGGRSFGNDPWGWRFFPAAAGIGTVMLVYVLARKLALSMLAAAVSAILLALDFMHFVNARAAILDIFVPFFGTAAFLFLVLDRQRRETAAGRMRRPWLLLSGISAGLATASKWSGAFVIFGVLMLAAWWAMTEARSRSITHPLDHFIREHGPSLLVYVVLVPMLVYAATYIGRVHGSVLAIPWTQGSWFRAFWDQQVSMYQFHSSFVYVSNIRSPAWVWPLVKRPMAYFYEPTSDGGIRWIVAGGNPLVWWPGVLAVIYCGYRWIKQRSPDNPCAPIAVGFIATYLVWIPMSAYRTVWISYFLPAIPFLCLAIGVVVDRLSRWRLGTAMTIGYVVAVIAVFSFFYPVLTGRELSPEQRDRRILFNDCDAPGWHAVIEGPNGPEDRILDAGVPPTGWCWGESRPV